jgi:hypothetical protein
MTQVGSGRPAVAPSLVWGAPAPVPPAKGTTWYEFVAGGVTVALVVALGAPAGLLWGHLAPRAALIEVPDGAVPLAKGSEDLIRADGQFLFITVLVGAACGLLAGILAARSRRQPGPGVAVGLAVGGLSAAAIAGIVGRRVIRMRLDGARHQPSLRHVKLPKNAAVHLPPFAHATAFGWACVAVAVFAVVAIVRNVRS